jgi:Actinobacteria/chloroflexi VLRF1 release factor
VGNPAAGGGRWVEVAPERFVTWAGNFGKRHGQLAAKAGLAVVSLTAADGSVAECHVPFPPMTSGPPGPPGPGETAAADVLIAQVAAHAIAPRTVAVLLVRLGGYAAGVFAGSPPELIASKTGSRPVHGRSAAGGWSQHRFARRREKQAAEALDAAAGAALRVFGPYQGELEAVVLGGDRRTVAGLRDDPRLRPYLALAADRFLTVPDPRRPVLRDTPRLFRAIKVRVSAVLARGATPRNPPLRSAPARWYFADTPATRRAGGPDSLGR